MTSTDPADQGTAILEQVQRALRDRQSLSIHGSGCHDFMLADYRLDNRIDLTEHRGIIDYQPSELTIKARAGTPLGEINQTLAAQRQRLATDIPQLHENATLGGALTIGHTGSGRPFLGALRDHVLGAGLINGRGERIDCGGQVMKNVAGYDISRLLCGSRGTLGPVLDITLKVLPVPEQQTTLTFELEENQAIESMNRMAGRSLPLTAAVFLDGRLHVRLEGSRSGVEQAVKTLGGEPLEDSEAFWTSINQQSHPFFASAGSIWRVVVPTTTPRLELEKDHECLVDWCGGLRWIRADAITQADFIHVSNTGGYIDNYRCGSPSRPADLMDSLQRRMHTRVKAALDPHNLFNPALSEFS